MLLTKPLQVLFDGGSKMLEVARFGRHISKNSVFLIHDWEDETFEAGCVVKLLCVVKLAYFQKLCVSHA